MMAFKKIFHFNFNVFGSIIFLAFYTQYLFHMHYVLQHWETQLFRSIEYTKIIQ